MKPLAGRKRIIDRHPKKIGNAERAKSIPARPSSPARTVSTALARQSVMMPARRLMSAALRGGNTGTAVAPAYRQTKRPATKILATREAQNCPLAL